MHGKKFELKTPSLHLFCSEKYQGGPYVDVEFLNKFNVNFQEKLQSLREKISPSFLNQFIKIHNNNFLK